MSQDSISILVFLIIGIIIIVWYVFNKVNCNKVERISENVKQLKIINQTYNFKEFINKKRKIVHSTNSHRSFDKTTASDVIGYHIENNINNIRDDIEISNYNKELYDKYMIDFNSLNYNTDVELINIEKLSEKKFKKIELKVLRKLMWKNVYNLSLKLLIYYRSPKGKNYYEKKGTYKYEQLKYYYDEWSKKKNYEISARYERSIMTDSIRYDVLKRDNYRCCICGISAREGAKLHVDHIVPVSKGGKTVMDNLQTLCERCNLGKSNKQ